MKNFDDILKKGKKAVSNSNPKQFWKAYVTSVMQGLHALNDMYGKKANHHLLVEQKKCDECGEATFILAIKDLDNHKQVLRFHKGDWESFDKNKYRCPACKKGK